MNWIIDLLMPPIVIAAVVACFLAIFVGIPGGIYYAYQDSKRPEFSLKKDAWACSRSHQVTTTYYIKSGAVMIPSTSTQDVCDQWSKK